MAQLDTQAVTWRRKVNVNDTVAFGGDLAAGPSAPATYNNSGAFSNQRVFALAPTDHLELDATFDAKASGDGIQVGLALNNFTYPTPGVSAPNGLDIYSWTWHSDQKMYAYEATTIRYSSPSTISLPMSCRIVYDNGTLKWWSNAGTDTLRYTSLRSSQTITDEMMFGLYVYVIFMGTSGKLHATIKGGDAATPEVSFTPPGRGRMVNAISYSADPLHELNVRQMPRTLITNAAGVGAVAARPEEGKIWPRNR